METLAAFVSRGSTNADTGSAADAVNHVVVFYQGLHVQEVAELLPEWQALLRLADGKLDMRNAVDFNAHSVLPV